MPVAGTAMSSLTLSVLLASIVSLTSLAEDSGESGAALAVTVEVRGAVVATWFVSEPTGLVALTVRVLLVLVLVTGVVVEVLAGAVVDGVVGSVEDAAGVVRLSPKSKIQLW